MEFGKVYLFPTPIAEGNTEGQLPNENLQRLKECDVFVVEELRTARRFLRKAGYMRDFAEVEFFVLNEHTLNEDLTPCIELIKEGKTVGVMSEAGLPCVADPGATFVALCQRQGIRIEPLVGPSSIMMAICLRKSLLEQNESENSNHWLTVFRKHKSLSRRLIATITFSKA